MADPDHAAAPALFGPTIKAVLFDLDGVVTDTAALHARAWQRLFDEFLAAEGEDARSGPFRLPEDYVAHLDGKPRYEGVRSFLAARGIDLPFGDPDDPPDARSVCGLGNRKNRYFNDILAARGVEAFPSTLAWIRALRGRGIRTACVSSSKNCRPVLERAGITDLFDAIFDGRDLEQANLPGKPRPEMFLRASGRLSVAPAEAAVVEDAVSGVEAARAGGFALVIGIDRGAGRDALRRAGADLVVADLADLEAAGSRG